MEGLTFVKYFMSSVTFTWKSDSRPKLEIRKSPEVLSVGRAERSSESASTSTLAWTGVIRTGNRRQNILPDRTCPHSLMLKGCSGRGSDRM